MQRQQNQLQLINDLKSKCQIGKYKGNHCHAQCKLSKWKKKTDKILDLGYIFLSIGLEILHLEIQNVTSVKILDY